MCTMTAKELETVLQHDSENEEEEIYVIDNVMDACRIQEGSMHGKCIIDFVYVFKQLHERFDEHYRRMPIPRPDIYRCSRIRVKIKLVLQM